MNDEQPTQPLTDAELAQIKERTAHAVTIDEMQESDADNIFDLINTVHRLRAALTALGRNEQAACNRSLEMQEENERLRAENAAVKTKCDRHISERDDLASRLDVREVIDQTIGELQTELDQLRAEATGTALGHLAKIERLQTERDALVRKLGLNWGPDAFGDLDAVPNRKGDNDE